jgi:hypothetical protein
MEVFGGFNKLDWCRATVLLQESLGWRDARNKGGLFRLREVAPADHMAAWREDNAPSTSDQNGLRIALNNLLDGWRAARAGCFWLR